MMSRSARLVVLVASVANFVVIADATIVIIALPSMASLGFTATTLPWVINAYAFVFGGGLLLGGVVADRYGPVRPFVAGMLIFAAGSVVCGVAGSVEPLLVGRAIQGAGGALCCPAALALATRSGRSQALALWSASGAAAVAVAPVLGGALTSVLGWPSVFWLPALVCVGAGVAALRVIPRVAQVAPEPASATADGEPGIVARIVAACGMLALGSAAVVGVSYVGTVWLQHTVGLSPAAAGLALLPLSAGIVAGSAIAPRLIQRRGVRWVAVSGLALAMLGTIALLPLPPLSGFVVALAVLGTGFGLQSVPVSLVATKVPARPGIACAAYQTAGQLGAGIGLVSFTALGAWQVARAGVGPNAGHQVVVGAAAVALMLALALAHVGWQTRGLAQATLPRTPPALGTLAAPVASTVDNS